MSCLITLGLCVWTAVHLNLPARDEQPWGLGVSQLGVAEASLRLALEADELARSNPSQSSLDSPGIAGP